jgi:hypothetical protein
MRTVCRRFRWQIPDSYNIGYDVCDRHAGDPTRRALIYEDAAGQIQEYTFLEIMRRSNRLANALAAQGSGRSDRIGILLPQSPETAIAHVRPTRWARLRYRCSPCSAPTRWSSGWRIAARGRSSPTARTSPRSSRSATGCRIWP